MELTPHSSHCTTCNTFTVLQGLLMCEQENGLALIVHTIPPYIKGNCNDFYYFKPRENVFRVTVNFTYCCGKSELFLQPQNVYVHENLFILQPPLKTQFDGQTLHLFFAWSWPLITSSQNWRQPTFAVFNTIICAAKQQKLITHLNLPESFKILAHDGGYLHYTCT